MSRLHPPFRFALSSSISRLTCILPGLFLCCLVALVAIGYLVTTLPFVRGGAHYVPALDITLPLTALGLSVALAAWRAWRVPAERAICLCLAGAILSWGLGDSAWFTLIGPSGAAPVPSWSDLGFLGFYPLAYAAIGLMLRGRGARIPTSMWLDGVIAGVTVAALAVAAVFEPIMDATDGPAQTVATTLAYPLADFLILALIAATAVLTGRAPMRSLVVLGAGLLVFSISDIMFTFLASSGNYQTGTPVSTGWIIGCAIMACAPWTKSTRLEVDFGGARAILLPVVCTFVALAIVVASRFVTVPGLGTVGAEEAIPPGEIKPEVAVGFVAVNRVVDPVHVGRDNEPAEDGFEPRGDTDVGVIE